jgi:hypothetical protein
MNGQAAYFSQSLRVNLKGTTSDEFAADVGYEKRRYAWEIPLDQLLGKQPD